MDHIFKPDNVVSVVPMCCEPDDCLYDSRRTSVLPILWSVKTGSGSHPTCLMGYLEILYWD